MTQTHMQLLSTGSLTRDMLQARVGMIYIKNSNIRRESQRQNHSDDDRDATGA